MAIQQYVALSFSVIGDGVNTCVTVDLSDKFKLLGILPRTPTSVFAVVGGPGTPSGTIFGSVLTVTWSTPPGLGSIFTVTPQFLF
jgi:hypothetical protein